jgi:radical SAM superfamily enzyme YgiQ (UPF0313 family)
MKVLLTNIGGSSGGTKPIAISLLSAILKQRGHTTLLFDTTFMDLGFMLDGEISDYVKQNKPVDWGAYRLVRNRVFNPKEDFAWIIEHERPDVIAVNAISDMYPYSIEFLKFAKQLFNIPVIIGGIHATCLPEEVIAESYIDAVCIGEGETALVEFVESIKDGQITRTDIPGLWIKKDGVVHKNGLAPLVDINELPFLDYDIYEERQFMRPYDGKILRAGDVQDIRGCPRLCPYCANAVLNTMYPKGRVRFFSPERFVAEMEYLVKTYRLEFFKIFSEDMFIRNEEDLAVLSKLYRKRVNIPFTTHGHPQTVTARKAKLLKNMNCVSVSMALEEGDYEYRKNILKRDYSDEMYIAKIKVLKDAGIRTVSLNMMGLPYETEAMIMKTFRLLRKAKPTVSNISMFFPYRGTPLGDLSIEKGFADIKTLKNARCEMSNSYMAMPQIKRRTLNNIRKMAPYFLKYPSFLHPFLRLYCKMEVK